MPVPHSTDNYTIPGGVKVFFDDGSGERDLGNITDMDIETGTEELEHFSNRSGKRTKDKVFTLEEQLKLKFKFDEPVIENLRYYFKGGAIENVGEGTATKTDQKLTLAGLLLVSVGQFYGLTNVTVRQFIDACLLFDGANYTDKSAEADSLAGTPFEVLSAASHKLYLGKDTPFKQVYANLDIVGVYSDLVWEYWDGSTWLTLTTSGAGNALGADGVISFTPPLDWAKTSVNGQSYYWIRASAGTMTTPATVNCFRQNCVVNVDYILDAGQAGATGRLPGRIGRLEGGMLLDGEEVKVSFTYTTWAGQRFAIAGRSFIEGSVRLEVHPDAGRGLRFDINLPRAMIKPNGAISLDDKKVLETPMMLEALDNSELTPEAPFGYLVEYDEAA